MKTAEPQENEAALKHFYNQDLLQRMGSALSQAYPKFDKKHFVGLMPQLQPLEMKARVHLLRNEMHRQLPQDYPQALKVLLASLRAGKLQSFDLWPYTEFVQTYGLDHLEISLDALKELTKVFTSEWAIRPFLRKYEAKTLKYLEKCAKDKDHRVRRWASEGSRPRLPWGERLHRFIEHPQATAKILDQLKFDSEIFVRKSVANHLNDIAKDNPDYVVKTLGGWKKQVTAKNSENIDWIIRHALRSLIKAGHTGALNLIGVAKNAKVEIADFKMNKKQIRMGDRISFEFNLRSLSSKPQKLVVDYVIHFVKANKTKAPKVFKLKTTELSSKEKMTFSKNHHIKEITTRDYYPGIHILEIQVNGVIVKKCEWTLVL